MFPQKNNSGLVLAPMEGVTDAPMRALMTEIGHFSYCVTEFIRVSNNILPKKVFQEQVSEISAECKTAQGTPIQIQLLGGDAELLAESAITAVSLGAPAIDLNFGCPAKTVNRRDGGASLLRYPHRLREIIAAVRAKVPKHIPVSAKIRLGWENIEDVHLNADMLAEGGANWITIHGRTKMQGYAPPANWKPIGEVQRRLSGIPIVANGDINSREDFLRCRDITGCKHFMIGRGALANPNLSIEIARELGISQHRSFQSHEALPWKTLMQKFALLCAEASANQDYPLVRIKQWARFAANQKTIPNFQEISRAQTLPDLMKLL